jgi:hypothetical protein
MYCYLSCLLLLGPGRGRGLATARWTRSRTRTTASTPLWSLRSCQKPRSSVTCSCRPSRSRHCARYRRGARRVAARSSCVSSARSGRPRDRGPTRSRERVRPCPNPHRRRVPSSRNRKMSPSPNTSPSLRRANASLRLAAQRLDLLVVLAMTVVARAGLHALDLPPRQAAHLADESEHARGVLSRQVERPAPALLRMSKAEQGRLVRRGLRAS